MKKMMMFGALLTLFMSPVASANQNGDFNGHWVGSGTYQTDTSGKSIDANFDLVISQTPNALSIKDCWTFDGANVGLSKRCYQSDYTINESAQVYSGQKKIGSIYPGLISIFQGDTQVSELMHFELNNNNELILQYVLINMDGGVHVRFSKLSPVR